MLHREEQDSDYQKFLASNQNGEKTVKEHH